LDGFLSKDSICELLETHPVYNGRDLNVTRYEEGTDGIKRRITLDPQAGNDEEFVLADSKDVWENFDSGCTLRLLCPHEHNDALHALLSTLEWEWGCMVGANVYLTPPAASQGFAPHYDDIEAFILQLEGYKHWKVYAPLSKMETLPRESSSDYTDDDLRGVEPVLDVVLGPGDLLYMPRGWIHQACTTDRKGHSLHLTISAMQQWSWVDYLELLIPEALEAAAASDSSTSLREGLPLRFLDYMGAIHDDTNVDELPDGLRQLMDDSQKGSASEDAEDLKLSQRLETLKTLREEFREEAKKRIMRVSKEALSLLDAACDQIGKRFIADRLPPAFTATEMASTSESSSRGAGGGGGGGKVWPNTLCRLARPGIARLALEGGKAVLYHCVDNSRVYQGNPPSPMEFEMDDAPALELLLTTVEPRWIQVQDLIHDDVEEKMEIAQTLYDEGILSILQTEKPDKSVQVG
jgi:lysine-specific demethylase/histidyl-hydroxylase NO66